MKQFCKFYKQVKIDHTQHTRVHLNVYMCVYIACIKYIYIYSKASMHFKLGKKELKVLERAYQDQERNM